MAKLDRTKDNPWLLNTPPGTSAYTMHVDEKDSKQVLVCTVGKTVLLYDARCIDDLHKMLKSANDWVELGGADEQKPANEGTVEAWGRSPKKSGGRLVRFEKGVARTIRRLHPAAHGSVGSMRVGAQSKKQPYAREVIAMTIEQG